MASYIYHAHDSVGQLAVVGLAGLANLWGQLSSAGAGWSLISDGLPHMSVSWKAVWFGEAHWDRLTPLHMYASTSLSSPSTLAWASLYGISQFGQL